MLNHRCAILSAPTLCLALLACSPPTESRDAATDATDVVSAEDVVSAADAFDATVVDDVPFDSATNTVDVPRAAASCDAAFDGALFADGAPASGVRGLRYCEILLANLVGGNINIDVYNTFGVSDCPQEAWMTLDAASIRTETMSTMAILNGPRYWIISGFESAMIPDPTVRYFGCVPMRIGGRIQLPFAGAAMLTMPYNPRTILRSTTVIFASGARVSELVDPMGRIFDMQSYSTQRMPQTEESLTTLGERLTLPAGWMYRSRVLAADLRITAVNGMATVVTDNFDNTYQLSAQ